MQVLPFGALSLERCIKSSTALCIFGMKPSHLLSEKYENALLSIDCTPALLGVGYIIGPHISAVLFTGSAIGWWVLIPLIKKFGSGAPPIFPSKIPVELMTATDVWSSYIRYIGAGAVAVGGIITLFKIAPVIFKTIIESFRVTSPSYASQEKRG